MNTNDNNDHIAADAKRKCADCGTAVSAADAVCPKCGGVKIDLSDTKKEQMEPHIILPEQEQDAFAEGLPEWSIEPPQTVIRRIVRR